MLSKMFQYHGLRRSIFQSPSTCFSFREESLVALDLSLFEVERLLADAFDFGLDGEADFCEL